MKRDRRKTFDLNLFAFAVTNVFVYKLSREGNLYSGSQFITKLVVTRDHIGKDPF